MPSKNRLLDFFWNKGFAVYYMRYRGTWESRGVFLKKSPDLDIIDVIDELPKTLTKIILVGGSFGGPAVILASRDPRVSKVIALCPVVSWNPKTHGPRETMKAFNQSVREDFGMVYRGDISKLGRNGFYEPVSHVDTIDGSKITIIHARDDDSVRYVPVERFANIIGANFIPLKTGGHLSRATIMKPAIWKKIVKYGILKA